MHASTSLERLGNDADIEPFVENRQLPGSMFEVSQGDACTDRCSDAHVLEPARWRHGGPPIEALVEDVVSVPDTAIVERRIVFHS